MNLAIRDIRFNPARFAMTAVGIGLLLTIVMGMGGIYRGLSEDALSYLERSRADLWIVQRGTRGPFSELSRIPRNLEDRALAVAGVARARPFVSHTIQREREGKPLRITVFGLTWPGDDGRDLPLVAGRPLARAHFEMLADRTLGLELGAKMRLGKDDYTVVGVTSGMLGVGGDGAACFTLPDAIAIQNDLPGEAIRMEREARGRRLAALDLGRTQPFLSDRAKGRADGIPALGTQMVSAVQVEVAPGVDVDRVREAIAAWGDVTVYTADEERELLLKGIEMNRRQIGLFRVLLVVISAIVMGLILYTLTLDKLHDIALLKLMGARNRVIVGMILQQALLLGAIGYALAWQFGRWLYPRFPRRVVLVGEDLALLALVVVGISVVASLLGIAKAMSVHAGEVLS